MGGYIGNPNDLQIVAALNLVFGSASNGLLNTQTYFGTETPFDDQHTLSRVAWRLNAYPVDTTSKGKWFGLLDNLKSSEAKKIQDVLTDALIKGNVLAVVFAVVPDPGNGQDYSVATEQDVNGASYITLYCPHHDYKGNAYPPTYTPPKDAGERTGVTPISTFRKRPATKKGKATKKGRAKATKSKKTKKRK